VTRLPITLNRLDPFAVTLLGVADALSWTNPRPIRIAATDDVNLHRVTGLVSLGGLDCDTELDGGWVTITVRAKGAA
jgi:hypothetical protein